MCSSCGKSAQPQSERCVRGERREGAGGRWRSHPDAALGRPGGRPARERRWPAAGAGEGRGREVRGRGGREGRCRWPSFPKRRSFL